MAELDVIVIGGGPGGSTAATMLARKGWSVRLFEREQFPREHVGESLLPASLPILEELGALEAVQRAGFLKKYGATMVWGTSREPWSWYFRETNPKNPHSYQVWRPQFDQILLENSRANGVDVREGHRVLDVIFEGSRATGVRVASAQGNETVAARFIVDASGQQGLIGRKLALRRPDEQFRNLAMYSYFTGAEKLPSPDETNILVESYPDGWTWVIPLHTGETSVGFVMDNKAAQEAISEHGPQAAYLRQLEGTARTKELLRNATQTGEPRIIRDWSYVSEEVAGDGYVLVGDAACFIDPLFSTGVHLALSAGIMGAAYVTTALKDPGMREAAGREYKELYYRQYGLFRELAALFYASNRTVDSYFWEARRILNLENSLAPRTAFIRAAAGQPPQGYERIVFNRGEVPDELREAIGAIEGQRATRSDELQRLPSAVRGDAILGSIPVLADGVRVERRPVLAEGEFEWGNVIHGAEGVEPVPVSAVVGVLVSRIDGVSSLAELVESLTEGADAAAAERLVQVAVSAASILYVDGLIAELRGLSPGG